jgi:hypothetical protein
LVLEAGLSTTGVLTKELILLNTLKMTQEQGVVITIENFEKMPMPVVLDIKLKAVVSKE